MRLTTAFFAQYIATLFPSDKVLAGNVDRNITEYLNVENKGVADDTRGFAPELTAVKTLPILVTVHWSTSSKLCEEKANAVYDILESTRKTVYSGQSFSFIMSDANPIAVGRDAKGTYEMVIAMTVYYDI